MHIWSFSNSTSVGLIPGPCCNGMAMVWRSEREAAPIPHCITQREDSSTFYEWEWPPTPNAYGMYWLEYLFCFPPLLPSHMLKMRQNWMHKHLAKRSCSPFYQIDDASVLPFSQAKKLKLNVIFMSTIFDGKSFGHISHHFWLIIVNLISKVSRFKGFCFTQNSNEWLCLCQALQ